jgi:hypothetical protein
MSNVIPRRKSRRILAAALSTAALSAVAALITAPAQAATISNPYDCTPQPTLAKSFLPWGDQNLYTPVPNAGLETGATGWRLSGATSVITGNETWRIGGAADKAALNLPGDSSAITAPLCIDETYPHFRLFVKNTGSLKSTLKIEVLYLDSKGNVTAAKGVDYKTDTNAWQPTGLVGINVFTPKTTVAAAPITFRFSTTKDASFQIDDVYVDPYARAR